MTPALLDDLVRGAASEVLAARGRDVAALPADAGVGCPRDPEQGEYATTIALRAEGLPAGELADTLRGRPEVAEARVAGPGFVNLWLTAAGRAAVVAGTLAADLRGTPVGPVRLPAGLVAAVGEDTARYAVLRGTAPDVALLARRVPENPAFRVRYAHARLAGLERGAADLGVEPVPGELPDRTAVALVRCLAASPAVVRDGAPHRLARHLEALADAALDLADAGAVLPRGDEDVTDLHRARLAMVVAARRVLAGGLGVLGVSAPERI